MGEPLEWAAENASLVEASWVRINNSEYITANNYAQGYTSPGRVCYYVLIFICTCSITAMIACICEHVQWRWALNDRLAHG